MAKIMCTAKTKQGDPCRAAAGPNGLCHLHAHPERAKTLGKAGGLSNRRFGGVDVQVPDNMTAGDLRALEVKAVRLLLSGEMQAREVGALVQLCNSLRQMIPTADFENRVATLERDVARLSNKSEPQQDSILENKTTDPQSDAGERTEATAAADASYKSYETAKP